MSSYVLAGMHYHVCTHGSDRVTQCRGKPFGLYCRGRCFKLRLCSRVCESIWPTCCLCFPIQWIAPRGARCIEVSFARAMPFNGHEESFGCSGAARVCSTRSHRASNDPNPCSVVVRTAAQEPPPIDTWCPVAAPSGISARNAASPGRETVSGNVGKRFILPLVSLLRQPHGSASMSSPVRRSFGLATISRCAHARRSCWRSTLPGPPDWKPARQAASVASS